MKTINIKNNKLDTIKTNLHIQPGIKLWFSSSQNKGMFGDGKWRLLEAIDKYSSIKKAAEILNISYRKSWDSLKKAENYLGFKLIIKQRGGKHGGLTILTKKGKELIKAYSNYHNDIKIFINIEFNKQFKHFFKADK